MGRRKKRLLRLRLNQKSTRSITALIFLLLALLAGFSYLGQAAFQTSLQNFLNNFFGMGSFFVPIWLALFGLALTQIRWEVAQPRVLAGFSLFVVSILSLIELFAQGGGGGGLVGSALARLGASVFSNFGALLVFLTFLLVSLLVIFNTSLGEALEFVTSLLNPVWLFLSKKVFPLIQRFIEERRRAKENRLQETENEAVNQDKQEDLKTAVKTPPSGEPEIEIVAETVERVEPHSVKEMVEVAREKKTFELPPLSLLSEPAEIAADRGDIEKNARIIEKTLASFGISTKVAEVNLGPAVTQYALDLAEGTKITKITALHNDLALSLAAPTGMVRIEAPIPGKPLVGVEVPNYSPTLVTLKSLLTSDVMQAAKSKLATAVGHNVAGEAVMADIMKWPHVLIAGSTGSGKSVLLHTIICSILFRARPDEVKFIMVDPKRVELTQYNGIPHLVTPVIVDAQRVISAFKWAVAEMEKRYKLFAQVRARNLTEFNRVADTEKLPFIVIVVDELADLMAFAAVEAEGLITRIAQMSRATGIHMVLSTQRPSVDVITGLIKANIPARIALNVSSGTDSRVIIDTMGAEKLLGRGDMLYLPPEKPKPVRIQGVFVSNEELNKIITHLKQFSLNEDNVVVEPQQSASSLFMGQDVERPPAGEPEDEMFLEALKVIVNHDKASASLLQRRLRIGYARAARLLDEMEERSLISFKEGSRPREVFANKISRYLLGQQGKKQDFENGIGF